MDTRRRGAGKDRRNKTCFYAHWFSGGLFSFSDPFLSRATRKPIETSYPALLYPRSRARWEWLWNPRERPQIARCGEARSPRGRSRRARDMPGRHGRTLGHISREFHISIARKPCRKILDHPDSCSGGSLPFRFLGSWLTLHRGGHALNRPE